jgi:uncharacterized protein YecT (DUF1311 family)
VLSLAAFEAHVCVGDVNEEGCRSRVEELDRKLNRAFREAIRVAADKSQLRADQLRWLVEVRDQASVLSFVSTAHFARIMELQEIAVRALGRRERPMKEVEQRKICDGIAQAASKGELENMLISSIDLPDASPSASNEMQTKKLVSADGSSPVKYFALPVRRGQEFPFAEVFTGGTCSSYEIRSAAEPLEHEPGSWPSEEIDPTEDDDVIRWATWGGGESVLMFGGRYFFVTTTESQNLPGVVTWVTPIGTRRPICSLEVDHVDRSTSLVRDDGALCSAAVREKLPAIAWKGMKYDDYKWTDKEQEFLLGTGLGGAGMPGVDVASVDIDNDGRPDKVGRAQYDSGAACGSSLSRLMLLSENGDHLKPGPMNDALMALSTINSRPVEIFSHGGSQYVRASLRGGLALFRVTREAVDTECVFRDQPVSRVKTLYPLDGLVRNPAADAQR